MLLGDTASWPPAILWCVASADRTHADGKRRTWNTPDAIAKHRVMTPAERIDKVVKLSREARKLATASRLDGP